MEATKETEKTYSAWIDRESRVVSFEKVEGYAQIQFPTHEEMFMFVIRQTEHGYRIQ